MKFFQPSSQKVDYGGAFVFRWDHHEEAEVDNFAEDATMMCVAGSEVSL